MNDSSDYARSLFVQIPEAIRYEVIDHLHQIGVIELKIQHAVASAALRPAARESSATSCVPRSQATATLK